jgi:hypothetical protein
MNMVDDVTGRRLGLLAPEETTQAAMQVLWQWIRHYGIPQALYVDLKNVFITDREPTLEEQLAGQKPLTAFGKACQKLGIELIPAYSPQAKGRVERHHGVDQDRLVKELGLRDIRTLEAANGFLAKSYWKQINAKFSVLPSQPQDFHRPVPKALACARSFAGKRVAWSTTTGRCGMTAAAYRSCRTMPVCPGPRRKCWCANYWMEPCNSGIETRSCDSKRSRRPLPS